MPSHMGALKVGRRNVMLKVVEFLQGTEGENEVILPENSWYLKSVKFFSSSGGKQTKTRKKMFIDRCKSMLSRYEQI